MASFMFKCTVLVAVLLGLFISGFVSKYTNFYVWLDDLDLGRGKVMKGVMPIFQQGEPWGYTYEELNATDLSGQVILVTGGNIGLGYWTAYHLASRNAEVVIACRDAKKCEDAAKDIYEATGKKVVPMLCNLGSFASIVKFTKEFKNKYNHLESLILNAGVGGVSDFSLTEDGIEMIIGINHFGHFLLTSELIPLLEKGAEKYGTSTVVSVSSASHYMSYAEGILPSIEAMNDKERYVDVLAYGQSKLANVLFAQELSERLKAKNVLVNSLHPGAVATQMSALVVQRVGSKLSLYQSLVNKLESMYSDISWKPSDASLTQIFAAVGKTLRRDKITGKYFHPIARENDVDPHAKNATLQKHLWDLTEQFIKAKLDALKL